MQNKQTGEFEPDIAAADPAPRAPGFSVPAGAWDCHAHVFGPSTLFPFIEGRQYTPPDQTVDDYLCMLDATGTVHGVLSQPSVYGIDNSCLVNALSNSKGRLRGIVVLDIDSVDDDELDEMHRAGVRGVRLNLALPGGIRLAQLSSLAARLAPIGWHLEVVLDKIDALPTIASMLTRLPVQVVIEQMGSVRAGDAVDGDGFRCLLGLVAQESVWCKLSHAYKISKRHPQYEDVSPYAQALIAANSSRLVWGSDWPHPRVGGPMPNDGNLLDVMYRWADGDAGVVERILSGNPARLYGHSDKIRDHSSSIKDSP